MTEAEARAYGAAAYAKGYEVAAEDPDFMERFLTVLGECNSFAACVPLVTAWNLGWYDGRTQKLGGHYAGGLHGYVN